ncbi:MAG: DUF420 domain-containing protein [Acidobacteria bacterium]|nr:DUF420 domain-containing protein [Acidobacteriota bacterium]
MLSVSDLPTLNAVLNATAAVLLLVGHRMIRQGRVDAHRRLMLSAFATSAMFLTSYVIYHAQAGSRPFAGAGVARITYFSILISHVTLAAAILPLAIVTLRRGLRMRYVEHVRLARWTWPIWMYVSVTGVVIYVMLYW